MMTSVLTEGHQPVVGGIFQEIVRRMVAMGGAVDPDTIPELGGYGGYIRHGHTHVTPFHPEALKLAAQEMVLEAGVRPLLHTTFVDALREDHRLRGAVGVDKAGLGVIRAGVLVDTSADGDVAAAAGAAFMKGRPEDGKMQPAPMFFRVGRVDAGGGERGRGERGVRPSPPPGPSRGGPRSPAARAGGSSLIDIHDPTGTR